ncbi:VOC family protein [Patescibacteria group bacterium]|nr:VOC family protein [Patescibacteria group bacterium]MBU1682904.1 VOC family protein [Patescibacteria group bacterium]
MAVMKFDHAYVSVKNMDRAIAFYEDLFGVKVANREENQWADFDFGKGCFFGLIEPKIIDEKRIVGNNSIPVFRSDDVDGIYEKVKKYGVKITFPPTDLAFTTYRYYCFECEDTEGNLIEIADYQRD